LKAPTVYLKEMNNPSRYGVPIFSVRGSDVVGFVEKPKNPPSKYAVLGVYCFTSQFFDIYPRLKPSKRGEYEITDALNELVPVEYLVYEGEWYDCGIFSDLYEASTWRRQMAMKT